MTAMFDGCMFDLFSIVKPNMRIRKPWRITTTSHYIQSAFADRLCGGSHDHVPCAGRDTKATECYSDLMVRTLHVAWEKHAHRYRKVRDVTDSKPKNMPSISFIIPVHVNPTAESQTKQFTKLSSSLCTQHPLSQQFEGMYSSSSTMRSFAAGPKGKGKGKPALPRPSKRFDDIRIGFTMPKDRKVMWQNFLASVIGCASRVAEPHDRIPDLRGFTSIPPDMGTRVVCAMRMLGSPTADLYRSKVIQTEPPRFDNQLPVNIFGDSSLNQYVLDRHSKAILDNSVSIPVVKRLLEDEGG